MKKKLEWLLSIVGKFKPTSSETISSSDMLQDNFQFPTNTDASLACEGVRLAEKDPACILRLQREVIDRRMPNQSGSIEGPEMAKMPNRISRQSQAVLELGMGYFSWTRDQSTDFYIRSEKRVYCRCAIDSDWKTYPLIANMHFRVQELQHRQYEAEKFRAFNLPSTQSLFVMETSLHLQISRVEGGAIQSTEIEFVKDVDKMVYSHEGKIWAELELSDHAIPSHCQRSWQLFLSHHCHLHPTIRERILQETRFPQTLTYWDQNWPREYETVLRLEEVRENDSRREWPVATGYCTDRSAESLHACLHALSVRLPINPTEVYRRAEAAVLDAVDSGRGIDGVLSFEELMWTLGGNPGEEHLWQVVAPLLESDPLAKSLLDQTRANSPEACSSAVEFLKSLDRTNLQKGDLLDVYHAFLLEQVGNTDEMESLFLQTLAKYPTLTGVWCELGNHYGKTFRHLEAWHCFYAARSIYPRYPSLEGINHLEEMLLRDFASYF